MATSWRPCLESESDCSLESSLEDSLEDATQDDMARALASFWTCFSFSSSLRSFSFRTSARYFAAYKRQGAGSRELVDIYLFVPEEVLLFKPLLIAAHIGKPHRLARILGLVRT